MQNNLLLLILNHHCKVPFCHLRKHIHRFQGFREIFEGHHSSTTVGKNPSCLCKLIIWQLFVTHSWRQSKLIGASPRSQALNSVLETLQPAKWVSPAESLSGCVYNSSLLIWWALGGYELWKAGNVQLTLFCHLSTNQGPDTSWCSKIVGRAIVVG